MPDIIGCIPLNITVYVILHGRETLRLSMNGNALKEARRRKNWTQERTALALDVTQPYLSMLEKGRRPLSARFVFRVLKVLHVPPTALPLRSERILMSGPFRMRDFSVELGALGYPGFSYLRARRQRNPAEVLLEALDQADLDARVAEGLPWLALTYVDMDWDWLVCNAKLRDRQNRLGFALSLATEVAVGENDGQRENALRQYAEILENSRLAREDTFCHDSMTRAERVWLRRRRSPTAAHWNLLTDMKGEDLAYAHRP
ncbi:MAG: helix-turn-helix transcriptional regulator [Candidatus Sulfotelmatobacter sp.]